MFRQILAPKWAQLIALRHAAYLDAVARGAIIGGGRQRNGIDGRDLDLLRGNFRLYLRTRRRCGRGGWSCRSGAGGGVVATGFGGLGAAAGGFDGCGAAS
jgi:hypothetical protein